MLYVCFNCQRQKCTTLPDGCLLCKRGCHLSIPLPYSFLFHYIFTLKFQKKKKKICIDFFKTFFEAVPFSSSHFCFKEKKDFVNIILTFFSFSFRNFVKNFYVMNFFFSGFLFAKISNFIRR